MNTPLAAYSIKVCRGAATCPHAVLGRDLAPDLAGVAEQSGWPAFLAQQVRTLRHHHQFRLAVSSCPNGCSQPHIADFGLIAFARPVPDPGRCTECGQCVATCAENALDLRDGLRLDPELCLGCAACARVCPTEALRIADTGWRVLLGGKLGRHPRLAHELGVFSLAQSLDILDRTLAVFMANYRPGLRLGEFIETTGRERFDAMVRP